MKSYLFFLLFLFFFPAVIFPVKFSKEDEKKCNHSSCEECDLKKSLCFKCKNKFVLHEGKCYDSDKLSSFLKDLKNVVSSPKEKGIVDFIIKDSIPQLAQTKDTDNSHKQDRVFQPVSMKFGDITDTLASLQSLSERDCQLRINQFIVDFEENIQVLTSLANLFEQKTSFEIEKQRNSIIELLNSEISPSKKLAVVSNKIEALYDIIKRNFDGIKNKISDYEKIANQKIAKSKDSFMLSIQKFFN